MPEAITISPQPSALPAFNYEMLRKMGIAHIEQTASSIWTDYNIHDPGITTLELLCYAITDLGYRSSYSIPDLLATPDDTAKNIHEHFHSAKKIFPNKAVTINDYRRLLIDIEKVKNAWIIKRTKQVFADLINKKLTPVPSGSRWEPVTIKGYYEVLLEFDTTVQDAEKDAIKSTAMDVLMANRNLCEDFVAVGEVQKDRFRLCTEIDISADAEPFETLAKIFFNIQLHLSPLVRFYWLHQMFDAQYSSDKIFEGPLLAHGFIKEQELVDSGLKSEIHFSDIMQQILRVPGVLNITEIIFNSTTIETELPDKWVIDVAEGSQPVVDIMQSNVVVYKDGMPFRPSPAKVKARFDELMQEYISGNEKVTTQDIPFDTGVFQNTGSYYSIQHHYPKNYGISHWGLPEDAAPQRKMQAKQLQGYLYFFDQQLANYLAQLSHVRNLFSLKDETMTYYTQVVNDFKDAEQLFVDPAGISANIQKAAETTTVFHQRRNLFLDHLLSRFAESFFDYVSIVENAFPDLDKNNIISSKTSFLANYPEYSSHRFSAYNYKDESGLWDTPNTSGLEKRLQRLLGFKNINRHTLVNIYTEIHSSLDALNVMQYWFQVFDKRAAKGLMVAADKHATRNAAENVLEIYLNISADISKYSIRQDEVDNLFIIELKDQSAKLIATSNDRFGTLQEANAAIARIVSLYSTNQAEEGMFLIEHILLLPQTGEDTTEEPAPAGETEGPESEAGSGVDGSDNPNPVEVPVEEPVVPPAANRFMPICVDENCDDCESMDPYSFRISIVLPAYAPRFLNMDFRRYCERIIRMETPAHIFPKICWVNNDQLHQFESAYQAWLPVKAGITPDPGDYILERFITILTQLKTVYPPARLQDCKSEEEKKLFLLNQNTLGTLKS